MNMNPHATQIKLHTETWSIQTNECFQWHKCPFCTLIHSTYQNVWCWSLISRLNHTDDHLTLNKNNVCLISMMNIHFSLRVNAPSACGSFTSHLSPLVWKHLYSFWSFICQLAVNYDCTTDLKTVVILKESIHSLPSASSIHFLTDIFLLLLQVFEMVLMLMIHNSNNLAAN